MEYAISEKMNKLKPSAIREILKYGGDPGVISLAAGDPAPDSLPIEAIEKIMGNIIKQNPLKALLYSQSEGHPPFRAAVEKLLNEHYNIPTQNNDVLIMSGAQQGIDLAAKVLCNEGDTVISENPSFIGALNAFRSYNVNLVGVDIDNDGINIEKLESALKANPNTKLIYVIPNFHNPTGITMSVEKRKAVYSLALKYNTMILEDNPYSDLRFTGESLPTIKSMDTEGIVIYAGSFSKILSSGIRLGYLVVPKGLSGKIVVAKQCSDVHTSMPIQLMALEFLENYSLEEHIGRLKQIYKDKCSFMQQAIDEYFPAEVNYTRPEGGLFIWCTSPGEFDSSVFAKRLVEEHKVCIVPGVAFQTDDSVPSRAFRLNYSMPSKEQIETGVALTGGLLKEYIK